MEKTIKSENFGKKTIQEVLQIHLALLNHDHADWSRMYAFDNVVTVAFLHGAISEGEGLITKNRKAREKIQQLEKENEILKHKLEKAQEALERWAEEYGVIKGKHFQGDLASP